MFRFSIKRFLKLFLLILGLSAAFSFSSLAKEESSFWVEFIDVGQGDCALVQCDGHYMLIDGGPSSKSSLVYSVLKNKKIENIELMVATHPDADHIGGLSGALNYAKVRTVLSPVETYDTKTFENLVKYMNKQNVDFTMPYYGNVYSLGSAEVKILGPIYNNEEINNMSIILQVTYGDTSFLFMGDAESEEENDILRRYKELSCNVLKVGHHGSKDATSNSLIRKVKPEYAVISVGADNTYGHPTQEIIDRLENNKSKIYRTDLQGDITFVSDGKKLTVSTEKNAADKELKNSGGSISKSTGNSVTIPSGTTYVLNTNSKKFHVPNCNSVGKMSAKNMQFSTDSAANIVATGYVPCKACNPYVEKVAKASPSSKSVEQSTPAVETQSASAIETPPAPVPSGNAYVLNTNTKKFHNPGCSSVGDMAAKNRKDVTASRDEVIGQGYVPCMRCNP